MNRKNRRHAEAQQRAQERRLQKDAEERGAKPMGATTDKGFEQYRELFRKAYSNGKGFMRGEAAAASVAQPAGSRRAMSTARRRHHAGHGAVLFAIRLPLGRRAAAEVKIRMPGVAVRPAADSWGECPDFFGESGCLDARRGGLLRRRLDGERSRQLRFGAAVRPGGDRGGNLLDLSNRNHPAGQQAKHNADAVGNAAVAVSPMPDSPRVDAKPPGDAALASASSAAPNSVAAAACGRRGLSGISPRSGAPEWTEIVIVMYLISISISIRSHRAYDAIINETAALGAPRLVETAGAEQGDGAEEFSQMSF